MRIENGKERVILTEKEVQILCSAKDIIDDIYNETQNDDIITYTEDILNNLDSLINSDENDSFEVVQEKRTKSGNVTFITIYF